MDAICEALATHLHRVLTPDERDGFASSLQALTTPDATLESLLSHSSLVRRRWRSMSLPWADSEARIETPAGTVPLTNWSVIDAARAIYLLTMATNETRLDLVSDFYRQGDEGEKISIIKLLPLIPDACSHIDIALDAGRTNSQALFASLIRDNPYPARCYDEHAFNQLVLKALFMQLDIDGIIGLVERANPELSRMCLDYINERQAAGRSLPDDIWLALTPHANEEASALLLDALASAHGPARYFATLAALQAGGRYDSALQDRLAVESDPRILDLLSTLTPSH